MSRSPLTEDEDRLAVYANELARQITMELGPWVIRSIRQVADDQQLPIDDAVAARAVRAADDCTTEVGSLVTALLEQDIDAQTVNPLQLLRHAVSYPSGVLRELGARPVPRDTFAVDAFPDDDFDLAPASFADIDPSLHEPGVYWGAAKAHVHLRRRREAAS